ncbi:MAG: sulfite exporter TauE/SafE family protein [Gammaproteobacteria bacterium]|nr:sulfite exporter TauE/SafE family protein [Gammaproteobacteria bacterium]
MYEININHAIITTFLLGILSTLHCVGMCGGIMTALTFGLPQTIRRHPLLFPLYLLLFSLGRILSYLLAGVVVSLLGSALLGMISPQFGLSLLRGLAALTLVAVGCYLAGWLPAFAYIEKVGVPLWRWLEPWTERLLPITSPLQALLYGMIWGWLPCGLVYSALLYTFASATATEGGVMMVAFGVGTLPGMIALALFAHRLHHLTRKTAFRTTVGVMLITISLVGLLFGDTLHPPNHLDSNPAMECQSEPL